MAMVEEHEKALRKVCWGWEIAEVSEHKVVTLLNVTDMDGFQALMTAQWMTEWDAANNCVDAIYSLEQMD